MDTLQTQLRTLFTDAVDIWLDGGWAMLAIALVAMVMFGLGVNIWLRLRAMSVRVNERTWRRWIEHPAQRNGHVGRLLDRTDGARSLRDVAGVFHQLRAAELAPFKRELKVMKICVGAAPLLGLLGTVTGMLATFGALASGSGGEKTMSMVAGGISEALITTETGLVVALPGLFFQYQLSRRHERYQAFLAQLESVCAQHVYRNVIRTSAAA